MSALTTKQKLIIALCTFLGVVTIVAASVLTTVAYLTSSAVVSNVFTIGKVGITMTESKVNPDGTLFDNGATRVDTNTYKLVDNSTYIKDPIITVAAESEDSYLFVLVRNDLEVIEDDEKETIAEQLEKNGWAKYTKASTGWVYVWVGKNAEGVSNVPAGDANKTSGEFTATATTVTAGEYKLFDSFSIDPTPSTNINNFGAAKITLTAYAIQDNGFTDVNDAWAAVVETYPYIHTGNYQ